MENVPHELETTTAYALALQQETQSAMADKVTLSPTQLGVKSRQTMDEMPENDEAKYAAGQFSTNNGSTIYNPLRSYPRVERILGEARYKSKKTENSPEVMANKLIEMQNKLDMLTALATGKPTPAPIKTADEIAEEKQGGITEAELQAMKFQNVVKLAKSLAIPGLKGIGKEECIKKILQLKAR